MGYWSVDTERKPGILWLVLEGPFSLDEMSAFVTAHNGAIDRLAGRDYRVFCDIRKLSTLSPAVAEVFERAKRYSSAHDNFQGSAVLVANAIVALQHRRTSTSGGVMDTELISEDEDALWRHLEQVRRRR